MGNLIRYRMNTAQLRQYLQIFTDQSDVTVIPRGSGSTHVPTRIVQIDPSSPLAPTTASHEGEHINQTSPSAHLLLNTQGEQLLLNALEDGRIERNDWTTKRPGLQAQWQEDVDYLFPEMLLEPWLPQTLKGMYALVGGYTFAEAKLKKQARDILTKFRPYITRCRKAATTDELALLVPEIVKLFNLPDQKAIREEKAAEKAEQKAQEESEKWWNDKPVKAGEGDEGEGDEDGEDEGWKSEPDTNARPSPDGIPQPDDEDDEDFDPLAPRPGDPGESDYEGDEEGDGNGGFRGQSGDVPEEVREAGGERDAIDYDADEAKGMVDAGRKLGQGTEAKADKPGSVKGHDRARGGPTVNQLLKAGTRLANQIRKLEVRAQTAQEQDTVVAVTPTGDPQTVAGSKERMDPRKLPASMQNIADLDKTLKGPTRAYYGATVTIDPKLFRLDGVHGGLGYTGSTYVLRDQRRADTRSADVAIESEQHFRATENYLARVLRILMQSADHKGIRDCERMGLLDPRRSYHINEGTFTIFKQPPKRRDSRPVVILSVDQSGSMSPGFYALEARAEQPAYHAMCATLVLSGALTRLGIPYEIHGFGSSGSVIKRFEDPAGLPAIKAISNIWTKSGGGTRAAEALGFAWARIVMRPEPRKILIQVTDGEVSDNTKLIADAIERMGGTVIGVGIGLNGSIRKTYKRTFEVANAADLPNAFARLLKRFIPQERAA